MDKDRSTPRWFQHAFRGLALAMVVGLAGAVLGETDTYGLRSPWLAGPSTILTILATLAFQMLVWRGAYSGYISTSDGWLYTIIIGGCTFGIVIWAFMLRTGQFAD